MERLHGLTISALTVGVALASGCSDEPLAPPDAASPPVEVSRTFDLTSEDRASLRMALLFTGQETVRGLKERGPAGRVAAAFTTLAARIDANDRMGTERAMEAARLAISRYRDQAQDTEAAPDLEAMDITLLRAASFVTAAYPTTIETEHQP